MKEWLVPMTLTVWATATIEAESASEARDLARFGDFAELDLLYDGEIHDWTVQPVSSVTEIK